jgi:hypothetical protein
MGWLFPALYKPCTRPTAAGLRHAGLQGYGTDMIYLQSGAVFRWRVFSLWLSRIQLIWRWLSNLHSIGVVLASDHTQLEWCCLQIAIRVVLSPDRSWSGAVSRSQL